MLSTEGYQKVIEKFMKSLQDGTLAAGDKIYSENQLARSLNIPRAQVHEVYSALSILGVLYGQQGRGTFLGGGDLGQNTQILYLMTLTAAGDFQNVLMVRRILETGGARMAAANRTEEHLEHLRSFARIIETSSDPQALTDADTALHAEVLKATGNALLHCLFQIVIGYMARISLQHWTDVLEQNPQGCREDYISQHWALVHAVERGDADELRQLLEHHFDTLERNYGLHENG